MTQDWYLRRNDEWVAVLGTADPAPPPPPPPPPLDISHGTQLTVNDVGLTNPNVLTTVPGQIVSTHDGQVIENLHVVYATEFGPPRVPADAINKPAVIIEHNNVTVRNCHVESGGPASCIKVESGLTGVRIEHCYLDGMSPMYGSNREPGDPENANQGNMAIQMASPAIARRCFITGVKTGHDLQVAGCVVQEQWVDYLHRNWSGVSMSAVATYQGSTVADPSWTVIERNRLVAESSAGVVMYPRNAGGIKNVVVRDNLVVGVGDGFGLYGGRSSTDLGHYCDNANIRIERNRFQGVFGFPSVIGQGTNAGVDLSRDGNTFNNNRWMPGHGTITGDLPARCGVSQNSCQGPTCPSNTAPPSEPPPVPTAPEEPEDPSVQSWQDAWDTQHWPTIFAWYDANAGLSDPSALGSVTTSAVESTHDGQVIENYDIAVGVDGWSPSGTRCIVVKHNNVTVRNNRCLARGSSSAIEVQTGVTGVVIEYNEISGGYGTYGTGRSDGNRGNHGIMTRSPVALIRYNRIYGTRQAIEANPFTTIQYNHVYDLHANVSGVSTSSIRSLSYITNYNGGTTIRRNLVESGTSGGLTVYAQGKHVQDCEWHENLVVGVGRGFGIYGGQSSSDPERFNNRDIRIDDNRFHGVFGFPNVLGGGTNTGVRIDQPGNTFDRNRWLGSSVDLPARCGITQDPCH